MENVRMYNIITGISIKALVHGAAIQYTYGFLNVWRNSNVSRRLALYDVTLDNRRKDA